MPASRCCVPSECHSQTLSLLTTGRGVLLALCSALAVLAANWLHTRSVCRFAAHAARQLPAPGSMLPACCWLLRTPLPPAEPGRAAHPCLPAGLHASLRMMRITRCSPNVDHCLCVPGMQVPCIPQGQQGWPPRARWRGGGRQAEVTRLPPHPAAAASDGRLPACLTAWGSCIWLPERVPCVLAARIAIPGYSPVCTPLALADMRVHIARDTVASRR